MHPPPAAGCHRDNWEIEWACLCIAPRDLRIMSPGRRVGSLPPSPLRTPRAGFPARRARMTNAPYGARRVRFATWGRVDRPVTVGMEGHQMSQWVVPVMTIPVMPVASLRALTHLSAARAPPVLPPQALGPQRRRRWHCRPAVAVLGVCLPGGSAGVGLPADLDIALGLARVPSAEAPFPGGRSGALPGCPWLTGTGSVGRSGPRFCAGGAVAPIASAVARRRCRAPRMSRHR